MGFAMAGPIEMLCWRAHAHSVYVGGLVRRARAGREAMDVMHEARMAEWEAMFNSPAKPVGVWVGGWRGTPDILSREMFLKYTWKYMADMVKLCTDYGVVPTLHLDSNWDNAIDLIKTLESRKVIVSLDGMTDIFRAAEILEGHSCIMGDVPNVMTSFGTPEEVDAYCERLIREVGPRASSCPRAARLRRMPSLRIFSINYPLFATSLFFICRMQKYGLSVTRAFAHETQVFNYVTLLTSSSKF